MRERPREKEKREGRAAGVGFEISY